MKIALISHGFPPYMTGGIESYTFTLAEELTKKGIDVTVFCGGKVEKELKHNFKIKRLPMLNFPPRALWFQLQNLNFFIKELKKFDIIHSQNTSLTIYSYIKKKVGKPWIVTFHDCPKEELKIFLQSPFYTKNIGDFAFNVLEYPLYRKMFDIDFKNADKIVPVGYSLLSDLNNNPRFDKNKAKVIQNGINIERIEEIIKDTKKKQSKKTRLIFFGRLFYRKGPTFLIEAMREVIKKNKEIILDIYGEGPLEKVIQKQIIRYHLEEYVKLHNFLPNKEILEKVCNSDIVILPSLYEAFPIAYLEAMTCKKPLIVFDYPFSREIIKNNKNGVLVKQRDIINLSTSILWLSEDKKLREGLGKNAYYSVKDRFNINNISKEYIKVYEEVLREHNKKLKQKKK